MNICELIDSQRNDNIKADDNDDDTTTETTSINNSNLVVDKITINTAASITTTTVTTNETTIVNNFIVSNDDEDEGYDDTSKKSEQSVSISSDEVDNSTVKTENENVSDATNNDTNNDNNNNNSNNESSDNNNININNNSNINGSNGDIKSNSNNSQDNLAFDMLDQQDQQQNDDNLDDLIILDKFFKLCEAQKLELAVKYILPALECCATHDEYMKVFVNLRNACFFNDVLIRSLWIEQIPSVVQYFHNQNLLDENLNTEIAIIISNLMQYTSYQIRKIAAAQLVILIEKNLIEKSKIEQYIIPCLLNLVNENNDDINIECVSLFGKLAPLLGRELTVKHLLIPFCRLCTSPVFHTRKVCATNIGEIATIVSCREVEEYLLPHFSDFVTDQVWAIRKVCAEIFSNIANKCTKRTRETLLTECFIRLLEDNSRWVKISAYKSLGSFIATFLKQDSNDVYDDFISPLNGGKNKNKPPPDPTEKKTFKNEFKKGNRPFIQPKFQQQQQSQPQQSLSIRLDNETNDSDEVQEKIKDKNESIETPSVVATPSLLPPPAPSSSSSSSASSDSSSISYDKKHEMSNKLIDENNYVELICKKSEVKESDFESQMQYSQFLYWRDSLPELKFDENDELRTINDTSKENQDEEEANYKFHTITEKNDNSNNLEDIDDPELYLRIEKQRRKSQSFLVYRDFNGQLCDDLSPSSSSSSLTGNASANTSANAAANTQVAQTPEEQLTASLDALHDQLNEQTIVPSRLLSYFITMVDMNAQIGLDSEMNYNCAYNFPAIAQTLGATYWKHIKDLYKRLAEDVNWKVRQTLAYSIHELAQILGTEVTQIDLVPIFDSYIKDVDEVRIGIVSNLSKFLRVLNMDCRQSYMPKLIDFLKMDNQRNWRFRNELALQISDFVELFPTECIAKFIQPVSFTLALDKVAEVRLTAIGALTQILKQFTMSNEQQFRKNFVEDVTRTLAKSDKWTFRQLYVILCSNILKYNADSFNSFCCDFLPHLLALSHDKVPNIRLSLARFISTDIDSFCANKITKNQDDLSKTIEVLKHDNDSDVKSYFETTTISNTVTNVTNDNDNDDDVDEREGQNKTYDILNDGDTSQNNENNNNNNRIIDKLNDTFDLMNLNEIDNSKPSTVATSSSSSTLSNSSSSKDSNNLVIVTNGDTTNS